MQKTSKELYSYVEKLGNELVNRTRGEFHLLVGHENMQAAIDDIRTYAVVNTAIAKQKPTFMPPEEVIKHIFSVLRDEKFNCFSYEELP
jgi:hypothetical protein